MPLKQIMKQNMSSYSKLKPIKQIISGSPKLADILPCCEKYLAHTPNEGLAEHTELVLKYLDAIVEANKLDSVIDILIENIIPNREVRIGEYVKVLFVSAILFHDFGKVNVNFQIDKMNNTLFERNGDKIASKHSLLGSYIFLVYHLDLIQKQGYNQEDIIILFGFGLLFSYTISNHHMAEFIIDLSKNEFEKYIDEFVKYLKIYNFKTDIKFEKQFFTGFNRNLKQSANFIAKENQDEFNLWGLLKLQYSLLTASDYYATNHYKSRMQQIYSKKEFGVIDIAFSKKIINSFSSTKEYNQKLLSDFEYYLNIPLSELQDPSYKNLCLLRQKLGAELIDGINNNKEDRVYYIEAPTGGGKTNLSMLAITKLLENNPDDVTKIFYVFPFTTLITQTYSVLKETFNLTDEELIQVHSKAGFHTKREEEKDGLYGDDKQNYIDYLFINYPLCLMSHIKFFDILKTNNKEANYILHRFANSIVVIDELQSYSPSQWDKLKYFISNFAQTFNMRFIIMSATLPKIENINVGSDLNFKPLIQDVQARFLQNPNFKDRVLFDFSLIEQYEKISINELSDEVRLRSYQYAQKEGAVHTIIEFIHKKSTTEFYDNIIKVNDVFNFDEIFVLSGTILEPRRREIINYLKDISFKVKNILLITTQVVEAGVDIDMDLGFKNISLLDSDEQLAGRINRNSNKNKCTLYLFKKDEPIRIYKNDFRYEFSKSIYKSKGERSQILENKDFKLLYKLVFDKINKNNSFEFTENFQDYVGDIKNLQYDKVNEGFKLIDNDSASFFVPLDIEITFNKEGLPENFSLKEITFLNKKECLVDNKISGEEIWNLYNTIIKNKASDFTAKMIDIKIINGILSKFTFSMFKNSDLVNDLAPFLKYDEEKRSFQLGSYYCFNSNYNQIYNYKSGLNEAKLKGNYFIF
jgi:CRISPR-associated endonuclease/helicase Cas3